MIMLVCIRLKGFVCASFTIEDDGHPMSWIFALALIIVVLARRPTTTDWLHRVPRGSDGGMRHASTWRKTSTSATWKELEGYGCVPRGSDGGTRDGRGRGTMTIDHGQLRQRMAMHDGRQREGHTQPSPCCDSRFM